MQTMPSTLRGVISRKPWVLVVLLTATGLFLRLIQIDFQPLWFDEGYSFYFAGRSIPRLISDTAVDIHPPLYYLILKGWMAIFGIGVLQARLLSVGIGTATIPLFYLLGRRLAGSSMGLWAAALLAISPFHIYYSQEVRMYGLVTLLSLLAGFLTLRAIDDVEQAGWWVGAGLAIVAALYTQYYAVFVPLALTIYLLLRSDKTRECVWRWTLVLAGALLAYLPWLLYAGPRLIVYVQYKVGMDKDLPLSPLEFLRRVVVVYGAGHLEGWLAGHWWLGMILPAITLLGLLFIIRRRQPSVDERYQKPLAFGFIFVLTPALGAYIINLLAPFNPPRSERLLLMALPAFYLLAAYAPAHVQSLTLSGKRAFHVLIALVCISVAATSLFAFYTIPRYVEDDYRPVANEIAARGRPDDAIICVMPWQIGYFGAYLPRPMPAIIETPGEVFPQARQFWADDPALMRSNLDSLIHVHGRVWTPAYLASGSPLEGDITGYLDDAAVRTLSLWHGTTHLSMHVPIPELIPSPATTDFAGRLRLTDAALNANPVESAFGSIVLDSTWEKTSLFNETYRLVLRLADDRDRTWGQWDVEPLQGKRPFDQWDIGESHTERIGLLIDAGVPPGHYALVLSLRNEEDAPLHITEPGIAELKTEVAIGPISVTRPATPVATRTLQLDHELQVELDHQLRLPGYNLAERDFTPGEVLPLTLYWHCLQSIDEELVTFVQLLNADGALVAATEMPPTDGFFPTSIWQAGDVVRDRQTMRLPASLPDGKYLLITGMFRQTDQERLPVTAGKRQPKDHIVLNHISVKGREHDFTAPTPAHSLQAHFGDAILLAGYDVSAGETDDQIVWTLYWQALREMPVSYKVFVHAYDSDGRRLAQHDSEPAMGQLPTSGWLAGEYVTDSHTLAFGTAPAAPASIWIGLYDPDSGQRLPLLEAGGAIAGDHLILPFSPASDAGQ